MDERPVNIVTADSRRTRCEALVEEYGSPLLLFDPLVLEQQYRSLQAALPGVSLHYALKALPHPDVIRVLDGLGAGFDVASAGEMALLMDAGINGRRTIHTHPVKTDWEIRQALRFGATTFVVDNPLELQKLVPYRNRVAVLLRVTVSGSGAVVDLSRKFGCSLDEVPGIVADAEVNGISVRGFSFHVGSQCETPDAHVRAIEQCAALIQDLNDQLPVPMATLDIGGGFPADYEQRGFDLKAYCRPIRDALSQLPADWHLLAEPGRALVAPAVLSITRITGKTRRGDVVWYYLDDGVYGSYSGQIFDHARYPLQIFRQGAVQSSVLAGPTCDGIDVIAEDIPLPELQIGDLVVGWQMGAYTAATRTRFNLLPEARFITLEGIASEL